MLKRFFRLNHCAVHDCPLQCDSVPIRYGLIKLRDEYRRAVKREFPHAKTFVLGGCRVGPPRNENVMYCPECRAAESKWNQENPDFDDPAKVKQAIESDRRDLPDSLAKRLLRQSQTENPERTNEYRWIVYRLTLDECIACNSQSRAYEYPYLKHNSRCYQSIRDLAATLDAMFVE